MGFNNKGAQKIKSHLLSHQRRAPLSNLGINIGMNKNTPVEEAILDYIKVVQTFSHKVKYYSINISSPNTSSLKDLVTDNFLTELKNRLSSDTDISSKKVWIKLAPNLTKKHFQKTIAAIQQHNFAGVILTNTYPVSHPKPGGLSGHSLLLASSICLEWAWQVHGGSLPMIGVGGILSAQDVFAKLLRGARAVQIYTALVYQGPWTVFKLLADLDALFEEHGVKDIEDIIGSYY